VVAEGVEDAATADALREVGCDLAQGYHFARPMDADALTRLLRTEVSRQPA
jgi:EAL domain-containing protein (putative c-di-GMP-specific phosphodiesterase class I)